MSAQSRLKALEGYLSVCEDVSRREGHEQVAIRFETARAELLRLVVELEETPEDVGVEPECSCREPFPRFHGELVNHMVWTADHEPKCPLFTSGGP